MTNTIVSGAVSLLVGLGLAGCLVRVSVQENGDEPDEYLYFAAAYLIATGALFLLVFGLAI